MSIDSKELLARLQAEPAPVSLAKLKKAYKISKKSTVTEADLLGSLASEGIHAWPKNSYWHVDPAAQLRNEILKLCTQKASKKAEIKVKGRAPKEVGAAIDSLVAERKLIKYPALAGATPLLVAAGVPRSVLGIRPRSGECQAKESWHRRRGFRRKDLCRFTHPGA